MSVIIAVGSACLAAAFFHLPFEKLDFKFLVLSGLTIGLGSRITVEIPRFKSHIAVSDTFIFIALLMYGGETAVVLATVEAVFSSWRFCNKKFTVFFNAAVMALSTGIVSLVLKLSGFSTVNQFNGHDEGFGTFFIVLSIMAVTQFIANTTLVSICGALKSGKPIWETWKTKYIWTFVTYFVGAISAAGLLQITYHTGFGAIIAAFPIIFFVYQTYRMYMKNVEMSIRQAEQAEQYAKTLEEQAIALRVSEERFRRSFDYAPIGIALVSPEGNWLKVNHALCDILGYTEEEFLGKNFQSMLYAKDLGDTLDKIRELLSGIIQNYQFEHRYRHKNGQLLWASWSISTDGEAEPERMNLIFQIQDITAKKLAEEQLEYKASHDALTGLPNRALFMSRLEEALDKIKEQPDYKVSVLFIDLDGFKKINDTLGHHIGDELLIGIAALLRDCLRPSDLVARLGGDEFTILVQGRYNPADVVIIADRINQRFKIPFDFSGREVFSSSSIGILHATENHKTPADLMRDADTAMYQAKRGGKARHEVFDPNMLEAVGALPDIEEDFTDDRLRFS